MAFVFALAIGASLALLGAGGSIITAPVLIYVSGLDVHRAAGTSLLVVGLVAAVGALGRWRTVDARTGLQFGLAGMLGAVPGAWVNHHVPATALLTGFALTVLITAERLLRAAPRPPATKTGGPAGVVAAGIGVGFATGLFGVGGGFLIVPALTLLLGVPMERAVATSLLVIALNSGAGLAGHLRFGAVDWRLGLEFAAIALLGAVATVPLAHRIRGDRLQRVFAGGLVLLGLGMLVQVWWPYLDLLAGGLLIGTSASILSRRRSSRTPSVASARLRTTPPPAGPFRSPGMDDAGGPKDRISQPERAQGEAPSETRRAACRTGSGYRVARPRRSRARPMEDSR